MIVEKWMVALLSLGCFASFAWAVKGHFRSRHRVPVGMRVISVASLAAMAWYLGRLIRGDLVAYWPAALALIGAAAILFWWAVRTTRTQRLTLAFDDDSPQFLQQRGPYRWIRHPFYASYIVFWSATSLATPGMAPWIIPVGFGVTYAVAARREEQKFRASSLASDYELYRSNTGMLLPLGRWRPRA